MEFTFSTLYDQKATTTMAKVLRKTLRKKGAAALIFWAGLSLSWAFSLPFLLDQKNLFWTYG